MAMLSRAWTAAQPGWLAGFGLVSEIRSKPRPGGENASRKHPAPGAFCSLFESEFKAPKMALSHGLTGLGAIKTVAKWPIAFGRIGQGFGRSAALRILAGPRANSRAFAVCGVIPIRLFTHCEQALNGWIKRVFRTGRRKLARGHLGFCRLARFSRIVFIFCAVLRHFHHDCCHFTCLRACPPGPPP